MPAGHQAPGARTPSVIMNVSPGCGTPAPHLSVHRTKGRRESLNWHFSTRSVRTWERPELAGTRADPRPSKEAVGLSLLVTPAAGGTGIAAGSSQPRAAAPWLSVAGERCSPRPLICGSLVANVAGSPACAVQLSSAPSFTLSLSVGVRWVTSSNGWRTDGALEGKNVAERPR